MFLWYVGLSVLLVANIFKSVGLDYRLIALGALLPLLVDVPVGHRAFGHTLAFAAVTLVVVMVWPVRGSRSIAFSASRTAGPACRSRRVR